MIELTSGWEVAATSPDRCSTPEEVGKLELDWQPATVPGTVAAAVEHAGRDLDAEDWWFRTRFTAPAGIGEHDAALEFDGLATICEVFLDGREILRSTSMWRIHVVPIGAVGSTEHELTIVCRALRPRLARSRRPRARWRTRVVEDGNLRWFRTMVFGRSPGFAAAPAAVGPWRPIRLVAARPEAPTDVTITARLDGATGVVRARAPMPGDGAPPNWWLVMGADRAAACPGPNGWAEAELRLEAAERWWPHTHGPAVLHEVGIEVEGEALLTRRVGFRAIAYPADIPSEGFALTVNDVPLFLRGAVWTPADIVTLAPEPAQLRAILVRVRDAGMNLLRVVGTGHYESPEFHDLCDELGILVWQDLMFANLDYPLDDPEFRAEAEAEARQVVRSLAHRPSFVCLCGNSEVEQQPAMMGLDPQLGRHPFWELTLPQIVAESDCDAATLRSTPCGGDLPFHPHRGVTHYFGVSGYFHVPHAARRAEVRFATECLAFANVPDRVDFPVHHPQWKAGVQRDAGTGWDLGAGWDFDDVRDHYLATRYHVDPVQLRRSEHSRYLDLARAVTGEVMSEVMGEWRREGSPCRGALVLWLNDMHPGAGLGILEPGGAPKVCYHHLRRALAPRAVWMTDEELAGVAIHIANDRPDALDCRLRLSLYRSGPAEVAGAQESVHLEPRTSTQRSVEGLLGTFVDAAWSYRFGPPVADTIVATLEGATPDRPIAQAFWFPRPARLDRESAQTLRLEGRLQKRSDGGVELILFSDMLVYGVRIQATGFTPADDAFCLEPGRARAIDLVAEDPDSSCRAATVTALNLATPLVVGY